MSSRVGLVANVGPTLASAAGIRLEDFIIDCRFMNDVCNKTQLFVKTFDSFYYNCFTFQPQMILKSRATRLSGVEYGLSLLLFLGPSRYYLALYLYVSCTGVQILSTALVVGVKVLVH